MHNDHDAMMANSPAPLSLQDFLSSQSSGITFDGNLSSGLGASDFADLLAEFTLNSAVMSPETLDKSPGVSSGGSAAYENEGYGSGEGRGSSSKSPEELMLQQLGVTAMEGGAGEGYEFIRSGSQGQSDHDRDGKALRARQLADAIATMDSATQAQLLSALQPRTSLSMEHPHQAPPQAPPYDRRLSQPSSQHGSPSAYPNFKQASSHQQSHLSASPAPDYFALALAHSTALNISLPPSVAPSPHASPFLHATPYYPPPPSLQQLQYQQQQLQLQQYQIQPSPQPFVPMNTFQNAFSPQTIPGNSSPGEVQRHQLTLDTLSRGFGGQSHDGGQIAGDMRIRGGSMTGESYATTAGAEDWGENDFMFTPLMSPALTPHSVFSQASSLPPSASCLPSPHPQLNPMNPNDFFSPLGSPAILPQNFQHPGPQYFPIPQQQQQQQHHQTMSPQLLAFGVDAGNSTGAGSGRRGAGGASKKSRPSPLLKPTPDSGLRRKKPERRSDSIGSMGARSTTTSPFLGPTFGIGHASSSTHGSPFAGATNNSARTSPLDGEGGSGSNNTPSPVDLAMSEVVPQHSPYSNSIPSYLPEFMGPPPLPSNPPSRRTSLLSNTEGAWMNPVTPATLMNFSSELAAAGLSTVATYPQDPSASNSNPTSANVSSTSLSEPASNSTVKPKAPKKIAARPASALETSNGVTGNVKGKGKATAIGGTGHVPIAARKVAPKPPAKGAMGPKIKPLLASGSAPDAQHRLSTKTNYQNFMEGRSDILGLDPTTVSQLAATQGAGADNRRTSHKAAEQKRRDSLKQCFEELRRILPPMTTMTEPEDRRPGEGNVGGQRGGSVDPENPNRGVSKVALLRRSNDFVGTLLERIDRRNTAIDSLRDMVRDLRDKYGEEEGEDGDGMDEFDHLDRDEQAPKTMEFYENLFSDDEQEYKPKPTKKNVARRKSNAADADVKGPKAGTGPASRRSSRNATTGYDDESAAMEIEEEE